MSLRRFAIFALLGFLGGSLVLIGAGEVLSRPATRAIGAPPSDFPAEIVRISGAATGAIIGWFARGEPRQGAVLLLHGVRADRTQMLARARFLHRAGYATLLIDLPAHGESDGNRITFGARESAGVTASIDYLRSSLPGERLGIIGVSLGAVATVLSHPAPAIDAVVLESMYPTIEEAVADRLAIRLGPIGAHLAPLLLWQLPLRTGVSARDLTPIRDLPRLGSPVLIAAGADDRHTTWPETRRLFDVAAAPKEVWRVDGAAHEDLHAFAPEEYERRILRFLASYLRLDLDR
jgi:alpha-beta hydrolase superfamily lysophospholipase